MSEPENIVVKGAREHNLKNVTLEIPKKKLVVFTGPSGSGKSSLAFDTLYAEGQRRYVESLSSYARQFLGQMEKPHYDVIRGLSPTISIEQKAASSNPRSTVGTITEVHDYLRVLFASIGKQFCYHCERPVGKQSAQQIADDLRALPEGTKLQLLAPIVQNRKGEHKELLAEAKKKGFTRVRIDGSTKTLDEVTELDKKRKHSIEIVVDRLVVKEGFEKRLNDSVETALKEAKGLLIALVHKPTHKDEEEHMYSENLACPSCGISYPELSPSSFSFNSPLGMCVECNGPGTKPEMDPDLVIPNQALSIREGAVEPWASSLDRKGGWTFRMVEAMGKALNVPLDTAWRELTAKQKQLVLYGDGDSTLEIKWSEGGRAGTYETAFEGVIPMLVRRYNESTSEALKKFYLKYFSDKACHACAGERLRPETRSVRVSDKSIVDVSRMTIEDSWTYVTTMDLVGNDKVISTELLKEIGSRLRFLLDVGLGYLSLERSAATTSPPSSPAPGPKSTT